MMQKEVEVFDKIVRQRQSVRQYDEAAYFDPEVVQRSLERAVLAPNSSNMQLWEFYRIIDPIKKKCIAKYCMHQKSASTANELVVFVTRRDNWRKSQQFMLKQLHEDFAKKVALTKRDKRALSYYRKLMPILYFTDWFGIIGILKKLIVAVASIFRPVVWQVSKQDVRVVVHKSIALAAQTFMLSMTAEGYATCPMEGMDSMRVKRLLKLPIGAEISIIIACGVGKEEGIFGERKRLPHELVIFKV